jgi:FAD/FMN-containing dehydrogenase
VVLCGNPEDVSQTVSFAKRSVLGAAARSGGHCFAGRSPTEGIVVDVSPMPSVSVSSGAATVGAGARLGDVYDVLDTRGLTIPAGCGPAVGIAGLALGGGLGILGRKHGLSSDSLLGVQVVFADGRIVECDGHHEEELFWALRGSGGGNFGVVGSLAFETVPAPAATAFHLAWPPAEAVALIEVWQTWAPDELVASLLLTAPIDIDRLTTVNVFGAMLCTESDIEELLDELVARAGVEPASAFLEHASYRETKRYLAEHGLGDDRQDGHLFNKSAFFRSPLPEEVVAALVDNLSEGRIAGQSRELDFTPRGGAYNCVPADATAFTHREERFLLLHVVVVDAGASAMEKGAARRWLGRSWSTVRPWGSGRVYPNFPDPHLDGWARAYHGTNLDRLARVNARYDPDGFFRFHQSIPSRVTGGGTPG